MNGHWAELMEMGSISLTESGGSSTNSSTESLNCLKFGQKIYFEDAAAAGTGGVTMGTPPKSGPGTSSSSGSGRKARVGGVVQGSQPPRCQVEGCQVDLSDAKAYYSRHKVCGMHSRSPKVIVAGLEQRFCQQCSRFHQLPEFDQGKRSCRRRLAGHNERRRKPPSGSLLSSRYGRLFSSIIESSSRGESFIMDFTAYPRLSGINAWPTARSSERLSGNQNTATGRSLPHSWQNNSESPPPDLFLQGSLGGTGFSSTGIPSGECFTGVGDSSCALSLLSNQPWGSRNRATRRSLPHPWQNNSENPPPDLFLQGSLGGTGFSSTGIPPGECFTGVGDSSCALSLLSNQPWGSRNRARGRSLPHPRQNNSENPPPDLFLKVSLGGTGFSSTGIPPGECFTGVGDSSCALSLLSNQPWGSRNRASSLGVNDMINTEGSSVAQPTTPHVAVVNPYSNASWGFKGKDSGSSSHEMLPHLGLDQISEPVNSQFSGGLELSQQSRRQHRKIEQSRAYDTSTQHIHCLL
ncbi:hypothetical protein CRYUN_Cryun05aG0198100 [Craigia yunnanensis]